AQIGATEAEDQLKTSERIQDQARALQQAVDGAIQLAAAFGLVGNETANILRSVGQMAAGVRPLLDAVDKFRAGTKGTDGKPLSTISTVIGAALPVAGA